MEMDELAQYLAALEREDCYRIDATLKESAHELTQRVFFVGANGAEKGPYVRKFIHLESGMGSAYERIFAAQQGGKRFKHVPRIHECYRHDDLLVVVMEFIVGETLQDVVYHRDPSEALAADVFPLICDAVTEMHETFDPPLIHRDLKPSNIMLADDGATIIDFGIAREYKMGAETDTTKFGTRAFAPPEQFGFGQTTVRSDVYALGMLLYYCITEKIPTAQVRDARFQVGSVPPDLRPILIRATALDPSERYASARELKGAFLGAGAHPSTIRRPEKTRHPKAIALVCFLVFATVVSGLSSLGTSSQADSKTDSQAEIVVGSTQQSSQSANGSDGDDEQAQADAQADAQGDLTEIAEAAALAHIQTSAPQRDGFDPTTNFTTTIAGVTFQIPRYFGARIRQGSDSTGIYYYAESGSSYAMLMANERHINLPETQESSDAVIRAVKDECLTGMMKSDEELFNEIVSSTDCVLVGYPARIATIRGSTKGLSLTMKVVYFINEGTEKGAYAIGVFILAQTDNTQFDYSDDFAKMLAAAAASR